MMTAESITVRVLRVRTITAEYSSLEVPRSASANIITGSANHPELFTIIFSEPGLSVS
jgi:hypothetical protein